MKRKNTGLQMNEVNEKTKVSMKTRIISAIIALIVVVPTILIGDWLFFALVVFFVFVSTYELIKCAKPKHPVGLYVIAVIFLLSLTMLPLLRNIFFSQENEFSWQLWTSFTSPYLSVAIVALSFLALFWFVVADANFTVKDACFIFCIGVALAIGLQSMLFIRYIPIFEHYNLVGEVVGGAFNPKYPDGANDYFTFFKNFESASLAIYIAIGTFMTDTGAYFIGVLFGKNKINPRISPKKTWEGFFGGIAISALSSFGFAIILALAGHPVLECFDLNHWYLILILSLLMPLFATLGDFTFSALKRHYEVKDFGNILPGHGGVLDRIDSLIFTASVSAIVISVMLFIVYPETYSAIGGNPFI